jgi:hypothetical protein
VASYHVISPLLRKHWFGLVWYLDDIQSTHTSEHPQRTRRWKWRIGSGDHHPTSQTSPWMSEPFCRRRPVPSHDHLLE